MAEGKRKLKASKDALQVPGEPDKSAGLSPGKKPSPVPSPTGSARESAGEPDGERTVARSASKKGKQGQASLPKHLGDEEAAREGWRASRPNSAPDLAVSENSPIPLGQNGMRSSLSDGDLTAVKKNPRSGRSCVKWSDHVQVETLLVPTCPEHGPKFMEFQRGTATKAPAVEFSDIACWVKPARALGARSFCKACNNMLGIIEKSDFVVPGVERDGLRQMFNWDLKGCFGCELALK